MRPSHYSLPRAAGLAAALVTLGAVAALAQAVPYFGLVFPRSVQGAPLGAMTEFENRSPGLGYGAAYTGRAWKADVYIYDLRRPKVSADLDSPDVQQQFEQASRDVSAAGVYRDVVVGDRFDIRDGGQKRFVCRSFSYTHPQAGPMKSALCLTSWKDKFVKIRLSGTGGVDAVVAMRGFAGDFSRALWPRA